MRFVRTLPEYGRLGVFLDPEKLVLPLPKEIEDKSTEEIDKYIKEVYRPLQCFNIETYETLKKRDEENWDVVYGPVNRFLAGLSEDIQKEIMMSLMMMHRVIDDITSTNLLESITQLGDILNKLDLSTNLCDKLEVFTDTTMPIPDLNDVGKRPQDTEEMTFHREHVVPLTAISLLCKMLAGVFGQFFWQYKRNTVIDNSIKEIHCAAILTPLFDRKYKTLILKLNNFLHSIILQQFKQKDDIISAINGNTISSQVLQISSSLYTRKLVTVDACKEDGNIMTYITTCAKNSADTVYRTASSKSNIKERDSDSLKESTSDEGNASRLENESFTSSKTADIPIIVEWNIELAIAKWLKTTGMSQDIYDQAMAYYKNHIPPMTPISNYLLCTYFGSYIGGATGISIIPAVSYTKLATMLQYILIKNNYPDLAHAIMLIPHERMKAQLSNIDNKVRLTWANTYAYRNFKNKFPYGVGDKECDDKLKEIVEFITVRVHEYNTAPVFWDMIGTENLNMMEYQCSPTIMENICNFINSVIEREDY